MNYRQNRSSSFNPLYYERNKLCSIVYFCTATFLLYFGVSTLWALKFRLTVRMALAAAQSALALAFSVMLFRFVWDCKYSLHPEYRFRDGRIVKHLLWWAVLVAFAGIYLQLKDWRALAIQLLKKNGNHYYVTSTDKESLTIGFWLRLIGAGGALLTVNGFARSIVDEDEGSLGIIATCFRPFSRSPYSYFWAEPDKYDVLTLNDPQSLPEPPKFDWLANYVHMQPSLFKGHQQVHEVSSTMIPSTVFRSIYYDRNYAISIGIVCAVCCMLGPYVGWLLDPAAHITENTAFFEIINMMVRVALSVMLLFLNWDPKYTLDPEIKFKNITATKILFALKIILDALSNDVPVPGNNGEMHERPTYYGYDDPTCFSMPDFIGCISAIRDMYSQPIFGMKYGILLQIVALVLMHFSLNQPEDSISFLAHLRPFTRFPFTLFLLPVRREWRNVEVLPLVPPGAPAPAAGQGSLYPSPSPDLSSRSPAYGFMNQV